VSPGGSALRLPRRCIRIGEAKCTPVEVYAGRVERFKAHARVDSRSRFLKNPNLGIIQPNLGTKDTPTPLSLADALLPRTRQRVIGALFGQPGRSFYTSELIALTRAGSGAVQRELADLTQVGLLTCTKVGHQKHYQANPSSPVFTELRGLVLKTVGLADVIRAGLAPLAPQIQTAFVFGSVAKGQDTAQSDVDLLVVSDSLGYSDLLAALEQARHTMARNINPALYNTKDFRARLQGDNAFLQRVMQQPKIWLIGQEDSDEPAHPV